MDTSRLTPLIRRFLDVQSTDPLIQEQLEAQTRRRARATALLQPDRISTLTKEELKTFLEDTDTRFGLRGNMQQFWERVFGANDERLPQVRTTLAELVRLSEVGLTAAGFNALLTGLPGIGPSYLSEIVALRFPDRYWLANKQIDEFLSAQAVDVQRELPYGKKGDQGERYMAIGRHLADLRRALSEAAGRPVDQLQTDLFIYWGNQQKSDVGPAADRFGELI